MPGMSPSAATVVAMAEGEGLKAAWIRLALRNACEIFFSF